MRPQRIAISAAAAALVATGLAVPPPRPEPAPIEAPAAEVPAVVLLGGAAPTTVTVVDPGPGSTGARSATGTLLALCGDGITPAGGEGPRANSQRDNGPCPPAGAASTADATFAVVKQPTPGADGLAGTEPAGPITPALRLLGALLPRSDLPAGRTTHLDPRPA